MQMMSVVPERLLSPGKEQTTHQGVEGGGFAHFLGQNGKALSVRTVTGQGAAAAASPLLPKAESGGAWGEKGSAQVEILSESSAGESLPAVDNNPWLSPLFAVVPADPKPFSPQPSANGAEGTAGGETPRAVAVAEGIPKTLHASVLVVAEQVEAGDFPAPAGVSPGEGNVSPIAKPLPADETPMGKEIQTVPAEARVASVIAGRPSFPDPAETSPISDVSRENPVPIPSQLKAVPPADTGGGSVQVIGEPAMPQSKSPPSSVILTGSASTVAGAGSESGLLSGGPAPASDFRPETGGMEEHFPRFPEPPARQAVTVGSLEPSHPEEPAEWVATGRPSPVEANVPPQKTGASLPAPSFPRVVESPLNFQGEHGALLGEIDPFAAKNPWNRRPEKFPILGAHRTLQPPSVLPGTSPQESASDRRFTQLFEEVKDGSSLGGGRLEGEGTVLREVTGKPEGLLRLGTESTSRETEGEFAGLFETSSPEQQGIDLLSPSRSGQSGFDGLLHINRGQIRSPEAASTQSRPAELQLPSGHRVEESRMVDQIVQHLHLGRQGEPSRITLKLHPEELGQVKLELVMEKEGMRAHLQAQSQQVQEVMERHLPRLRDALEQQGLKLHDLRVSVDSQGDGGRSQFQGHQRHAQSGHFSEMPAPSGETGRGAEDLSPFHQHPMRSRPGGVNLMV